MKITAAQNGPVWPITLVREADSDRFALFSTGQRDSAFLYRWDPVDGRLLWRSDDDVVANYWVSGLTGIRAGGDNEMIVAAGTECGMFLWSGETGRQLPGWPGMDDMPMYGVASGPLPGGGAMLIGGADDGAVYRWDAATGTPLGNPLRGHEGGLRSVASTVLSDGSLILAAGDEMGEILRWNALTEERIGESITAGDSAVNGLSFLELPDRRVLLVACDAEGLVHRWDALTGERIGDVLQIAGDDVGVAALVCARIDGEARVIVGGDDGRIHQWNAVTGAAFQDSWPGVSVDALALEGSGVVLAAGTQDGDISVIRFPHPDPATALR